MAAGIAEMASSEKESAESVRIRHDVLRMARIIASIEDVRLSDLLSDTLHPIFEKKIEEYEKRGFGLKKPKRS